MATAVVARADTDISQRNRARYQALDTFAQALSLIRTKYVREVEEVALIHAAAQGMTSKLDRNSGFYDPRRYKRMREDVGGEYGGIGVTSLIPSVSDSGRVGAPHIATVLDDSPAARAGLQVGDLLLEVDGHPTSGDGVDMVGDDWLSRLRGPVGSRLRVVVVRPRWDAPRSFELVREHIKVPTVEWFALEPGIGYIAITKFQDATSADLERALDELSRGDFRVLIFDLRDNPGGLVDQAIKVADLFIARGTIVSIRGRPGVETELFEAHAADTRTEQRIIALVDQDTASAAEIVAAALRDHERATLIGVKTYGKGSVQTFFDLDDGSGLKLTTAYYHSPNGHSLDHHGIEPNMQVEIFAPDVIESGGEPGEDGDEPLVDSPEDDLLIAAKWTGNPAIPLRLRGDHQFDTAHQTARSWLESKPGVPKDGGAQNVRP